MNDCKHESLELLPERKSSVRCRHCHLTLSAEELGDGYCPECFDRDGTKNYQFETLDSETKAVRYRCEDCGAIIATR
jgi:predicted RNA-binding Zn-ribbon protein involved in translation (DUF1610 family)